MPPTGRSGAGCASATPSPITPLAVTTTTASQPIGWRPDEYQHRLLSALGSQDPADVQARTPALLRALVAEAGTGLRSHPVQREWSVLQCIAHICDAELVIAGRYRWILAHETPDIQAYDQDLWVDRLHAGPDETADEILAWFEPLRAANLALWQRTPVADRSRLGLHEERGPESYELTFRITAGDDLVHLGQARQTLEQVRAAR